LSLSLRSLLYIPALAGEYLAKARSRGADAIIIDLEDSIPMGRKSEARAALGDAVQLLASQGMRVWVRVNSVQALVTEDLEAATLPGVQTILLPKVESELHLHRAEATIAATERARSLAANSIELSALVETPMGIMKLDEICGATSRLASLSFGSEDLSLGLGVEPAFEALHIPAQMTVIAARAYGLSVYGVPGSVSEYRDVEAYRHLCVQGRTMGFDGVLCIHPRQVEQINGAFAATKAEMEYARRVIEAYETAMKNGVGAVALDGKMIDLPVVERARKTLAGNVSMTCAYKARRM